MIYKNIEYELIRSQRSTLGIELRPDGSVRVRAPKRLAQQQIESVLEGKRKWIERHLAEIRERCAAAESFVPGKERGLLLLGREYPLERRAGTKSGFDGERFFVPATLSDDELMPAAVGIYRKIAKSYLKTRTLALADEYGERVERVAVNFAKTRWGSCSSKGNINFSLLLMMASPQAVDYCVIHELSHLRHMNHSAAFWALVKKRDPDFAAHRAELADLQERINREGWK